MSDNYLDTYRDGGIYESPTYGSPYIIKGVKFARFLNPIIKPGSQVLCIGCGNGFEVIEYLNQGHDAYGTELHECWAEILKGRIINAVVPDLPFKDKEFDLLHSTEVLEHIPQELTEDFLRECARVSTQQFFSAATEMDTYGTHINLNSPSWWYEMFVKAGLEILNFQFAPIVMNRMDKNYTTGVYYSSGVTALCGKRL